MLKKWNALGVQWKLQILILGSVFLLFLVFQQWIVGKFESQGVSESRALAFDTADSLINGMNMLMVTGKISDPENRKLLVSKMASMRGVEELRIIRAKQVRDQFGPGLPEEQPVDELDRRALSSGQPVFEKIDRNGTHLFRAVIPFVVSTNFRGTNCLQCHHVKAGSVNGAASVTLNLSEEELAMEGVRKWLWLGLVVFQVILSAIIGWFVKYVITRNIENPLESLKKTMLAIRERMDLSRRAEIDGRHSDVDDMARTFNVFVENLEQATNKLALYAKVFENSEEAIIITDAGNEIISVNRAFSRITGYAAEEVIGKNPRMLSSGMQGGAFYEAMWRTIVETGHWQGEIWNRRKSGEVYPEWLSVSTERNDEGELTNHIAIFTDITSRKRDEERIRFLAYYDSLTELPNRALFEEHINRALSAAKRNGKKVALLFLDVDRFKSVNDSLGHLAGDLLLQSVATRLKKHIRESDTICRQGGDEFIIVLTGIETLDAVVHVAEKIVESMGEAHSIAGHQLVVSFSIGISMYPDDGQSSEVLIRNADAAMYHAKDAGRNNFQFFSQEMNSEAFERLSMESDLRQALKRNELLLHYQPKIDIHSGGIIGMEALVRWQHPEKGLIPPDKFIPVAEECGLIVSIGEWVLRTACAQCQAWHESGLFTAPVAVNISALQFRQKNIRDMVASVLQETGLAPHLLELELTESMVMQEAESTIVTLHALKELGVSISIDDFGTGYSSLNYLRYFPVDRLKIDRSFVQDISSDKDDAAITRTIISMGHSLRMKVIAEGVETTDQFALLREQGCDEIQGYYYSKPLSAEDFCSFLRCNQPNLPVM
ncbi:MAG: EAL domain-containing protein [Burkholderiales bacterium]|nr:EAL domain-containing protein [Burkholderiales bacterium]